MVFLVLCPHKFEFLNDETELQFSYLACKIWETISVSEIKEKRKFGEEGLRALWSAKSSGITERYRKEGGLLGGSGGKESGCNAGDMGSIPSLGRFLEKGTAIHSGVLAWRISWTISPWGCKESDTAKQLSPL